MNVNIRPKYLSKTSFWNTFGNVRSWKIGYGATPRGFAAERETARRSAPRRSVRLSRSTWCVGALREFLLHSSRPFKGCKLLRLSLRPIRHIVRLFSEYLTVYMCVSSIQNLSCVMCVFSCVSVLVCVCWCLCHQITVLFVCVCVLTRAFVETEYFKKKLKLKTNTDKQTHTRYNED